MESKIELAAQAAVEDLYDYCDRVVEALGTTGALVTDVRRFGLGRIVSLAKRLRDRERAGQS